MTKKKEEDYSKYFYDPKKPRDLAIESYPKPEIKWEPKWRVSPAVIDAPSSVRIYEPPIHYDAFLNYLEWKMNRPWYKRLFLP